MGVSRDCPMFCVPPITAGTLKAMNFKFGRNICRLNPSKRPLKILETRGRGSSQGLSKIFRAATYRAHRAVVFAIAQLSCVYYRYYFLSIFMLDMCRLQCTPSVWCSHGDKTLKLTISLHMLV